MQRITTATAVADLFGPGKAGFTDGTPGMTPATDLNADWFNHVQEEIANIIESLGGALSGVERNQIATLLQDKFDEYASKAFTLTQIDTRVAITAKSTEAQAQDGTDDTTWMTPLKTKQAIQALQSSVGSASESAAGTVEFATTPETVAGTDTARATHPAGVKAAIQSAIAGLVNSSPAALDTLNELAASLGNDPNFAATITNALASKLALTGGDMSGRIGIQRYDSAGVSMGSGSGARTIDLTQANYFQCTAAAATAFTFSGAAAAGRAHGFVLELTNGGAYTITWPASVKWPGGTAPTLTAAGVDVLIFVTDDGGVAWRGNVSIKDSK